MGRVSSELVELGHEIVAQMAHELVSGARALHVQLLASRFYEAVKAELEHTPRDRPTVRGVLAASADQCRRSATNGTLPPLMLVELRAAVAMLTGRSPQGSLPPIRSTRPLLRVVQGGRA